MVCKLVSSRVYRIRIRITYVKNWLRSAPLYDSDNVPKIGLREPL